MKQHLWQALDDSSGGRWPERRAMGRARPPWRPAWSTFQQRPWGGTQEEWPSGESRRQRPEFKEPEVSGGYRAGFQRGGGYTGIKLQKPSRGPGVFPGYVVCVSRETLALTGRECSRPQQPRCRVLAAHPGAQLRPEKGPTWALSLDHIKTPLEQSLKRDLKKDHTKDKYTNACQNKTRQSLKTDHRIQMLEIITSTFNQKLPDTPRSRNMCPVTRPRW